MTAQPAPSCWCRLAARLRLLWALATTNGVVQRSLLVAAVVGTILTLINQGDKILQGRQPVWWKVALTYCVPFCVATYGAVTARLAMLPHQDAGCVPSSGGVAVVVATAADSGDCVQLV